LTPRATLTLEPSVAAGAIDAPSDSDVFGAIELRNPTLIAQRVNYEVAERALNVEIRKQYPDLEIGPAYEYDEGQNKVGFGLGLPLPILNANKQGIAVARAKRDAVRIAYETQHERLVNEYAQAQTQHASATAARQTLERELLPLADAQIADERRMAELGELNVLLTLESIVRAHETRVRLIDATLAESRAAIRIQDLLGPGSSATEGDER
jgi:outer membrane protein TolC